MKKISLFVLLIFSLVKPFAQEITGTWNGLLSVQGTEMRLIFHVEKTAEGYQSTMDSPDQKVNGITANVTTFKGKTLRIEIADYLIQYKGKLVSDSTIEGTFNQGEMSFPLNLSRDEIKIPVLNRPQEPQEPFAYYSEEVRFENIRDSITLAGTLTLPDKEGVFPVVIMISGSGPQNRNEELLGHKPFLVIAHHLTLNGIGVLRFDDRGTAESTGNFSTATTLDFATDVEAALDYLLTRKEINKNQIGLIGHSEGGIIAPLVASKRNEVSYIVLLAGTGIRGDQLLLSQQELIGRANGASEKELTASHELNSAIFKLIVEAKSDDSLKVSLRNFLAHEMADIPRSQKPKGVSDADLVDQYMLAFANPWMIYFIKHDPAPVLKNVKCPVLALNGDKDLQVPSQINLAAIQKSLEDGGNKRVTIKELPNLNHLFQECTTGSPAEYASIEQTFAPVALNEISTWILDVLK